MLTSSACFVFCRLLGGRERRDPDTAHCADELLSPCSGHNSRDSCKQGQLWLLSILITSSGDCEFAELGATPRLVVVSLRGNMRRQLWSSSVINS